LLKLEKKYLQLASLNRKSINEYNEKMLSAETLIGGILLLLPVLASPFSVSKKEAIPAYLIASGLFFLIFFAFKIPFIKKYRLVGLYLCFSIFFGLSTYLSVYHSPNTRATILLGAFCITPLGFIDNPRRVNLFVLTWLLIHTVLAAILKPQFALDDTINALCFAILGCFIGNIMIMGRLEGYEARRLLIIEKETDVLTGVLNRRKLFESLAILETKNSKKPSGILMIDIDYFKDYNDSFGHAAGDLYLQQAGGIFNKFSKKYQMTFYRYGGEEFVAMLYEYTQEELMEIAEDLRSTVENTDMEGKHITVSIGVAYCGDEEVRNYEHIIERADRAVYQAKRSGRNKVFFEPKEESIN